jgi:hypothetical protein
MFKGIGVSSASIVGDELQRDTGGRGVNRLLAAGGVVCLVALPCTARSQAELQGHVFGDSSRRPIRNAEVALPRLNLRVLTDSLGRYRLQNIPRGEHLVVARAVGFRPDSAMTPFDGDEALVSDVVLRVAVNELPTVAVKDASRPLAHGKMAAYEERKALGVGHFIDRALLAKDENRRLGDILASNVPGLSIYRGTGSKSWAASGRTTSSAKCAFCRTTRNEMLDPFDVASGAPLACYLDVYLDGAAVYSSSARGTALFNLNSIEANQIEAIEVYTGVGQIPAQYNKTSGGCGVLLIWTRDGRR